jgi:hypothetical protein
VELFGTPRPVPLYGTRHSRDAHAPGSSLRSGHGLLVVTLAMVMMFEATNGFHDAANAVATVIYTKSLKTGPVLPTPSMADASGRPGPESGRPYGDVCSQRRRGAGIESTASNDGTLPFQD